LGPVLSIVWTFESPPGQAGGIYDLVSIPGLA
jgi:hypothetical protein